MVIAASAGLASLAPYIAFPDRFIFFGIHHAIALSRLIGLPLVFLPGRVALLGATIIIALSLGLTGPHFKSAWLASTGSSTRTPPSLDDIPMVPWLAPFLPGIATSKLVSIRNIEAPRLSETVSQALAWPGRHSLVI